MKILLSAAYELMGLLLIAFSGHAILVFNAIDDGEWAITVTKFVLFFGMWKGGRDLVVKGYELEKEVRE